MSALTDILLAPDVRPFAVAAAIMLALGGIELLTTLVGFSISELVGKEVAVEADSDNGLGGLFLWINAGRLPLLILIILALGVFSIAGFFLQGLAHGVGISIPVSIAAIAAAGFSLPVDPRHQPRHRPHHPARRDLCGGRGRFHRSRRRSFDRAARPGTARPRPSQGCLRQLAFSRRTRQSRIHAASGRRQRVAGRP